MIPHVFFIIVLHTKIVVSKELNMLMTNIKLKNILQGQTASQTDLIEINEFLKILGQIYHQDSKHPVNKVSHATRK